MPSDAVGSAGLPPLGAMAQPKFDAELAAMLALSSTNLGSEWNPPPCPKHSWLDDWFLGSEHRRQLCFAPSSFLPENA